MHKMTLYSFLCFKMLCVSSSALLSWQMSFVLLQVHIYSLGMTLFWGADHEVPQSQVSSIWFCLIPQFQTGLCDHCCMWMNTVGSPRGMPKSVDYFLYFWNTSVFPVMCEDIVVITQKEGADTIFVFVSVKIYLGWSILQCHRLKVCN